MTTTIKVTSHNHPALVEVIDRNSAGEEVCGTSRVLKPHDGEQSFYCTTTRTVRITDIEYDDPRADIPEATDAPVR